MNIPLRLLKKAINQIENTVYDDSVPVGNETEVRYAISRHYIKANRMRVAAKSILWDKNSFYDVPESEIKPEWL